MGKLGAQGGGPPYGLMVVPPGEEAAFLAPLPVTALWGVGPKTGERLAALGVRSIGELADVPAVELRRLFGTIGDDLHRRALGIDERPIQTEYEAKSVSAETTFARDMAEGATLQRTLRQLSDQVAARLRRSELAGTTVRLKLRWPDFTTLTRQTRLAGPTDLEEEIFAAALALFQKVWRPGRAVRLLGVGVSGLGPPARQLSLFDPADLRGERLAQAVDALRARYGRDAVRRASTLEDQAGTPRPTG
ncbi:MAG: hypothetical protein HY784_08315 [Chloroflexi bacterium]|nr:hypothetical protein [Chloroflexota bacterium]